jgi:hypothetical protein
VGKEQIYADGGTNRPAKSNVFFSELCEKRLESLFGINVTYFKFLGIPAVHYIYILSLEDALYSRKEKMCL